MDGAFVAARPDEKKELTRKLFPGVRDDVTDQVRDDNVYCPRESDAFFHLLKILGDSDVPAIDRASLGAVTFVRNDTVIEAAVVLPPESVTEAVMTCVPELSAFTVIEPLGTVMRGSPPAVTGATQKAMAYAPPMVYSHVTGVTSPTGAEAEGWLISVGGTPKEILAHEPEFTYEKLLAAAEVARGLGAQIMGLGAFTKVVGDAGVTVARKSSLPITTGHRYPRAGPRDPRRSGRRTSSSWFRAPPQSSEAAVKIASPIRNTRRCPTRSPIRPASSSSPPNGIM